MRKNVKNVKKNEKKSWKYVKKQKKMWLLSTSELFRGIFFTIVILVAKAYFGVEPIKPRKAIRITVPAE